MIRPTRATPPALLALAGAVVAASAFEMPSSVAAPGRLSAAAADRTTAQRAVLRLADLPGGWTASDPGSTRKPSACAGFRQARATVSARANSRDFVHATSQASHTVYVYADARRARSAYVKLTSATARRCVGAETKTKLEGGGRVLLAPVRTSSLKIARIGDQSAVDRIAVDYRAAGGGVATLTLDLVFVRERRALSLLALVDDVDTFDVELRTRLASIAGRRLRTLLAR
jgi:hypothetical protein